MHAQCGRQRSSPSATLSGQFPKLLMLLKFSGSLELPFSSLPAENWGFINPNLLCTFHDCQKSGPTNRRAEGEEKQWDLLHCLEVIAPQVERKAPLSEIQAPVCPH